MLDGNNEVLQILKEKLTKKKIHSMLLVFFRISLAESEIATERLSSESNLKIQQLEAQIQVLAKLSNK